MTTESETATSATELEPSQQAQPPAPGAEDQKPNPEAPASEAEAQNPEETPEQQEQKRESRRQRSNARKAAELAAAKTEARILREELERTRAQQAQPKTEAAEPKREDFQDYETYLRAVTKYDAEQAADAKLKAAREADTGRQKQAQQTVNTQKLAEAWTERERAYQAVAKDYEEVVGAFVDDEMGNLSPLARAAIVESEVGPQLLHQLANLAESNPGEYQRITALSPARQVAELGKLESKVSAPAKRTTNAPPPASVTTGGKTAAKDPAKMSQVEYEAWRKGQGARWAR